MKYSAILLSGIAASGAMAAPQFSNSRFLPGVRATVSFGNRQNAFTSRDAGKLTKFSFGGITTVKAAPTVKLDFRGGQLPVKPRCKANDKDGNTFVVQRGGSTEFTFADGEEWTFVKSGGAEVAEVICDNTFTKAESQGITVTLATTSKPGQDALKLSSEKKQIQQVDSELNVKFVTLTLGPQAFQDTAALRCKIMGIPIGSNGQPQGQEQELEVNRGDNTEFTFGDGFKGAWRLTKVSKVTKLLCDPSFTKAPAPITKVPADNNDDQGIGAGTNAPRDIAVQLGTPGENAAGTINLASSAKNTQQVGQFGPEVLSATLRFDDTAQTSTRCALLGQDGQPVLMTLSVPKDPNNIEFVRNIGGTDQWDVVDPQKGVVSVECDPALKKEVVTPKPDEVPVGFQPSGLPRSSLPNQGPVVITV